MSLRIGDTVGDYQITGVLGKGGMGEVFRVRNLISDRLEAMKVVVPEGQGDTELAERFLREIKLHASLDHPNIAVLHTALRVEGQILMVMELVEGTNLAERLREGPIEWREAVQYVGQVLCALSFAHARGVIHRDIKPANIMVTAGRQVKLTDFGIARSDSDPRLTLKGMALGSLLYMSPEQVQSAPVDARSDLYSVGVTFYEMVTGKRPFRGENHYELMTAHLTQAPTPPVVLNPGLPPGMSAIILRALEKNPAARFQTAADFQAALRVLEGTAPAASVPASAPAPVPPAASVSAAKPAPVPPAASVPPTTPTTVPPPFDAETLAGIEARLIPMFGPVTRKLVTRAARQCRNVQELCRALAEEIPEQREREAFLRSCEGAGATDSARPAARPEAAPAKPTGAGTVPTWDPAVLRKAKEKLVSFIGPVAGVMVDRTARKVRTPRELYDALAAEIPSERDRQAFLASLD